MNHTPHPPTDAAGSDHARTWALIPWLVNGRASAAEQQLAMAHLQQCPSCRAEWQAQQGIAQALQQAAPAAEALPDAEAGLQRLLGRLDTLPEAQPQAADATRNAPGVPAPHAIGPSPGPATPNRRTSRLQIALAAAVVAQAVGLSLMTLHLLRDDRADYTPLSQAHTAPAPGPAAATLRLLPDGSMPLASWQALLQSHGLTVVEGPNSAGAYAVAPRRPDGQGGPAATAPADLLGRLRATPGILLAEPLPAP